ncbi:iron-containing alcohol dehydrogenase [uncultured Ruthenibacterium sp.]|mgnify:CR=1 FL=1|uniref:iron-containing alcohol dehydrogenase n=1 Tax=uncultured Ruthenibacterium sp. TaxID=1905347 RepID=UPI00349E52E5
MLNFDYDIPTKVFFGKGQLGKLGPEMKKYGDRLLLVYGGGSIKRTGLYAQVLDMLRENGIYWQELSGVEPNPRIESVREGADICKRESLQMVLAVGGGSSIDCAKYVAAAANYDGDAWDLCIDKSKIKKVLPVFSVLTLAATGSEMDCGGVITNLATYEKIGGGVADQRPKASVLDPTYTFTVPANQTAAGTVDIMSHTMETYFNRTPGTYFQDRMAEAILKTCIHYGPIAIQQPDNYEARANLMWASSWAINDFLADGKANVWTVHPIEHELSAFYDITHGVGLAILTPRWMKYVLRDETVQKFVEYGVNVWGISPDQDPFSIANEAIRKTEQFFFEELKIPSTLTQLGIGNENFERMAKKVRQVALDDGFVKLTWEDVVEIYKACL